MKKYIWIFLVCVFTAFTVFALGYSKSDKAGKTAPYSVAETPENLAKYFMEQFEKPADRARALASWMVYQMDKNIYRENEIKKSAVKNKKAPDSIPNDPFKTRVGTPQEYADLYQKIGTLMGLEVATIQGYAGKSVPFSADAGKSAGTIALRTALRTVSDNPLNNEMQPYYSTWNAVKIGDEWKLVDTYWMSRGSDKFGADAQNKLAMIRLLKNRERNLPPLSKLTSGKKYDETFFFADPRIFIRTHFPLEEKWQLLEKPVSWRSFTK